MRYDHEIFMELIIFRKNIKLQKDYGYDLRNRTLSFHHLLWEGSRTEIVKLMAITVNIQ